MKIKIDNSDEKYNFVTSCFTTNYNQSIIVYINTQLKWKVDKIFYNFSMYRPDQHRPTLEITCWLEGENKDETTFTKIKIYDLTDKEIFYFSNTCPHSQYITLDKSHHYLTFIDPSIFFKENNCSANFIQTESTEEK